MDAAARYLPGTAGAEVGGDWYDVIPLDGGAVGLAIGDVAGHDLAAATEMGQLRNALRAYAFRDDSPSTVLDELRRFYEMAGIERIATVTYLWLAPSTGEVRMASAGHLPPVVQRASGQVEVAVISPAPPLGVPSPPPTETTMDLGPGDTILLLTDGLVETRTAGLDDGFERLALALTEIGDAGPEALCDRVIGCMVPPGERRDDVALLAVKLI